MMLIDVQLLSIHTTDSHVLDIIGDSGATDKVKLGRMWCISVEKDNSFSAIEEQLVYSGEIREEAVFCNEQYDMENAAHNEEYADAIRILKEKSTIIIINLQCVHKTCPYHCVLPVGMNNH